MKKILIPTDFSENSKNAIRYALDLFKETPCHYYLLYVNVDGSKHFENPVYNLGTNILVDKKPKVIDERLKDLVKLINSASTKNQQHQTTTLSEEGFFLKAIRKHVLDKNIELIVMGTRGATEIKEFFMGSHAGDVITKVECDVLIIPDKARYTAFKQVIFPVDFESPLSEEIIKTTRQLIGSQKAHIKLLYITKSGIPLIKEIEILQKQWIEKLSRILLNPISFHRVVASKIEHGIDHFAKSTNADLIIMISKDYGLLHRLFLDTTVEEVSFCTKIPLLSIQGS
ncbi:universal stress protein [Arenibacter latericius]|uniref:universal stress protein n=1 Tax=Arenibacter latericius TaxID=86104 RepID=UPI00041E6F24|nr:universal stress protein [Arenibacter latericius]